MIHLLREKATPEQVGEMLAEYTTMIKLVVDTRRRLLAGGGLMHADCEEVLLQEGSDQADLWGANWYPEDQRIEFEALVNIRPGQDNRSMTLQSDERRRAVEEVVRGLLGGVR